MEKYNFKDIENKWKDTWAKENLYEAVDFSPKPKKYILAEFPYPSGKSMHAGHMMRYTVPDIYARFLRMKGYNVLFPFGYDAFGLPAENYAITTGNNPALFIQEIISHYRESVKRMGYGIDWSREITTTDPKYYKWTQWLFLQFYIADMAKYQEMPIWWCEKLRTVLSDEEVINDKNGNKISERGAHPVEKRLFKQWVLEITKYADKLLEGLSEVDFPESIKASQTNWIGKSEGAYIDFEVNKHNLRVFTTRPDTLFGVTFLALSPDHSLLSELVKQSLNKQEVQEYINTIKKQSDLERLTQKVKSGIQLQGLYAQHPLNEIKRNIPIFVTNYVLTDYGTGAIMGVPAHDERDNEFAKKYDLEIIEVINNNNEMINSGLYDGQNTHIFFENIVNRLSKEKKGEKAITYKMRDWIFSRQRYWGEPIPIIHKKDGSYEAICDPNNPDEVSNKLPLVLPELTDYNPTSDGASPLEKASEWLKISSRDGSPAKRETNTMPNWAGSCWYYIRYIDPHNDNAFADYEKMKYWLPVDRYFGGAEHTTLHLLYSRYWHRFFYDKGLVPTKEPYAWRMNGGMLLAPDGKKMSKSKGNGIEPMELVDKYGADALRLAISFLGPYEDTYPWNENGMKATSRLISTMFELSSRVSDKEPTPITLSAYNTMVKKVTEMIESLKCNTAVSEIMIFTNHIKNLEEINSTIWSGYLRVVAPFAPFITEELWHKHNKTTVTNKENSIHTANWPAYSEDNILIEKKLLPIQINGKIRSTIELLDMDTEETVRKRVVTDVKVMPYLQGKNLNSFLYIPSKIISITTN